MKRRRSNGCPSSSAPAPSFRASRSRRARPRRRKGPLELHVYPGQDCSGQLYWDDGVSIRGDSLRQTVRCTLGKDGIMLHFDKREGSFRPWWKQIAVTVHGWSGPAKVRGVADVETDAERRTVRFVIPDQKRASDFVLSRF